jgi:peptide/nickel transport system substrate-binding protein
MSDTGTSIEPGIEAKEAKDKWGTEVVIGSGPYKLREWKPGEVVRFDRFEDYHVEGLPYADGIEVLLNLDAQATLLRFESRELEWMLGPSAEDAKRLLDTPDFHDDVRFSDALLWSYVAFAWNVPPFNDVRMRQAVSMAIDKVALCATSGGATVPWDQGWAPGLFQNDPNFKPKYPYNPEEAKKIVDELYPNGVNILFWPGGVGNDLGQIIQADLAAVGINAELVTGNYGAVSDRLKSGEIQMVAWGNSPGFPDASGHYEYQICDPNVGDPWPSAKPCNEERNKLIAESNKLPITSPERTKILQQVHQDIVNGNVEIIPLRQIKMLDLYAQYVQDFKASSYCMLPVLKNAWIDQKKAAELGAKLKLSWEEG